MNNKKAGKIKAKINAVALAFIVSLSVISFSCQSHEETVANVNSTNATPEKKRDDFQDNLSSVQRAGFTFIYTFRRPDGEALTGEDKKYLKDNAPADTNQWLLTADGKGVVAGSNYKFTPEHLDALRQRFTVEDYSKPSADTVNENANVEAPNKSSNSGTNNKNSNGEISNKNSNSKVSNKGSFNDK